MGFEFLRVFIDDGVEVKQATQVIQPKTSSTGIGFSVKMGHDGKDNWS